MTATIEIGSKWVWNRLDLPYGQYSFTVEAVWENGVVYSRFEGDKPTAARQDWFLDNYSQVPPPDTIEHYWLELFMDVAVHRYDSAEDAVEGVQGVPGSFLLIYNRTQNTVTVEPA